MAKVGQAEVLPKPLQDLLVVATLLVAAALIEDVVQVARASEKLGQDLDTLGQACTLGCTLLRRPLLPRRAPSAAFAIKEFGTSKSISP